MTGVRRLESHLVRSSMGLLVWMTGLISAILMAVLLYLARFDQTQEGNRANLQKSARDVPIIVGLLADASVEQRQLVLKYLSDPSDASIELGLFAIDWIPERLRDLYKENLVQWVERGQRFSASGKPLGAAPKHWLAAMYKPQQSVIFTEPADSLVLSTNMSQVGIEILLARIDADRAVVLLSPRRLYSEPELWGYAGLGLLLLWLLLLLSLSILVAPIVYWISKRQAQRIASQLASLSASAEQWALGETDVPTHNSNVAELQQLSASFERMAGRWQETRVAERAALGSLEASIANQRAFVADISHDLRTPLTAVLGYTERALRRTPDDADLRVIAREGESLNRLVTNLFELAQSDLSKADPAANRLHLAPLSVRALLLDLVDSFAPQAWQRGVLVRVAENAQDATLAMDRHRLIIALKNLIDNALQHTEEGGLVELDVQSVAGQLVLSVTDTGTGIAPELIAKIFQRGVRGDSARTRRGGGLGLAIAQHIVQQHRGHIELTSALGKGSQFRLVFAAVEAQAGIA
jgi:signal transduction histidine kinase